MTDFESVVGTLAAVITKVNRVEAIARNTSKQIGPAGKDGKDGFDGGDGIDGKDGRDGIDGKDGRDGIDGKDGRDGIDGKDGRDGADGKDGRDGADGKDGQDGAKGDTGPAPEHQWKGTKLRWRKPDGEWGKFVDLKGEKGKDGENGGTVIINRAGGASGGGIGNLLPGNSESDPTGIAVLQGGQWVNLSWQSFIAAISGAIDMGSVLSRRVDFVGDTLIYRGEAAPGSADGDPVWRIKRIQFVIDGTGKQDIIEMWAGGDAAYSYSWTNRETLGYA